MRRVSLAALLFFLGCGAMILTAGCAPDAKPPVGGAPNTTMPLNPMPTPASAAPAATDGDSAADFAPPDSGELIADLQRDLQNSTANDTDVQRVGDWTCLASPTFNPWDDSRQLAPMTWSHPDNRRPRFEYRRENGESQPSVTLDADNSALLLPAAESPHYPVLRWSSSEETEAVIQGRFTKADVSQGDAVETMVLVDGIPHFHADLSADDSKGKPFRIQTAVLPGSVVDFVVSPSGIASNLGLAGRTRLRASVYRLSSTESPLRPDPQVVAKISSLLSESRRRALPKDADSSQSHSSPKARFEWLHKRFIDWHTHTPLAMGAPEEAVAHSTTFLNEWCRWVAKDQVALNKIEISSKGWHALEPIRDASMLAAMGTLAPEAISQAESEGLGRCFFEINMQAGPATLPPLPGTVNPPKQTPTPWPSAISFLFRAQSAQHPHRMHPAAYPQHFRRHAHSAYDGFIEACSDPGLTNQDRYMLIYLLDLVYETTDLDHFRHDLELQLGKSTRIDPWIRDMLVSREYLRLGWKARGSGYASTVSAEQFKLLGVQLARAKLHALRAWQAQPDMPEAPALLIRLVMADGPVAGEDERFWFDQAVQADFADLEAYENLAWALRPRWGGSHSEMFKLAQECLATGRFDTAVPAQYRSIVADIASERGGWEIVLKQPAVYDGMVAMLTGYEQAAKDEQGRHRYRSQLAAAAWVAGKKDETRRILNELGPQVDRGSFREFDLVYAEVRRELLAEGRPPRSYFPEQTTEVTAIAFLPAGDRLVHGAAQGEISVWNVATKQREQSVQKHSGPIVTLCVSHDGQRLLSADRDGKVAIWSLPELKFLEVADFDAPIHAVAWTTDGKRLAVSHGESEGSEITLWDFTEKMRVDSRATSRGSVNALKFAAEDKRLIASVNKAGADEDQLLIWDIERGAPLVGMRPFNAALLAFDVSPDGKQLVAGGFQNDEQENNSWQRPYLQVIDLDSGQIRSRLGPLPGGPLQIIMAPEQEQVLCATHDGTIVVWEPSRDRLAGFRKSGFLPFPRLAYSSTGSVVAAVDSLRRVQLWRLEEGQSNFQIDTPLLETNLGLEITNLQFLPGGQLVAATPYGGTSIWDESNGLTHCAGIVRPATLIHRVYPFPDNQRWFWIFPDAKGYLVGQVIDVQTQESQFGIAPTNEHIFCGAVSPNGKLLAVGDSGNNVLVFDAKSFQLMPWGKLQEHTPRMGIYRIAFSADSTALVAASGDGTIKWWDLPADSDGTSDQLVSRFTSSNVRFGSYPQSLAISADKTLVASGLEAANIFDASTGKILWSAPGRFVAFSPDSQRIAMANGLPPLDVGRIRDARTGKILVSLEGGHKDQISEVVFSPDGKTVLTGDNLGVVRAWNAQTGEDLLEFPVGKPGN
jgi:WD40 repeat protein